MLTKPIKSRETLEQLLDAIRDFIDHPEKELLVVGSDSSGRKQSPSPSVGISSG